MSAIVVPTTRGEMAHALACAWNEGHSTTRAVYLAQADLVLSWLSAARAPAAAPAPANGVRVRVAVAVDMLGQWHASGGLRCDDAAAFQAVFDYLGGPDVARYVLTATLPLPRPHPPAEIVATVEELP